jgi:hypothetical protein
MSVEVLWESEAWYRGKIEDVDEDRFCVKRDVPWTRDLGCKRYKSIYQFTRDHPDL